MHRQKGHLVQLSNIQVIVIMTTYSIKEKNEVSAWGKNKHFWISPFKTKKDNEIQFVRHQNSV